MSPLTSHSLKEHYLPGWVYLVGAGPGDPGLLTLRGAAVLAAADVVIYDRLAAPELLDLARPCAERIFVGKERLNHALDQAGINQLLAERARAGQIVCRLKGGDPFVFGRGAEEADFLRQRGIPFIVVPGVSSAVAVPAYAGIPLTDRRCASSFAVITGHREAPAAGFPDLDWAAVSRAADTLVFLMGLANLPHIAAELLRHGRAPETPCAVIQEGTTPRQRAVFAPLGQIAARAAEAALQPPAILVVGEVTRFHESIDWFTPGE
jgi:uroporphyrinogen III methyltransferase/synthase